MRVAQALLYPEVVPCFQVPIGNYLRREYSDKRAEDCHNCAQATSTVNSD